MRVRRGVHLRLLHWAARGEQPRPREVDDAALLEVIREVHADSGGTYGEPRVTAELWSLGHRVNHKRVERLMRAAGLEGHRPRRRRSLTKADERAAPLPDLVGRLFNPDQLDHTWVGDITFVPTDEGWLYLATVIDLASRRLLGWSMGDRHDAGLVTAAVKAAVAARARARMPATIMHSDSEYADAPPGEPDPHSDGHPRGSQCQLLPGVLTRTSD